MRVLAARFSERGGAAAALVTLERELHPPDIAVAPLAHPGEKPSGEALLAGLFSEADVPAAVELVERAGGEMVANLDERRIRPVA
jgi:hypothetical protein